jgi:hypothetical protein
LQPLPQHTLRAVFPAFDLPTGKRNKPALKPKKKSNRPKGAREHLKKSKKVSKDKAGRTTQPAKGLSMSSPDGFWNIFLIAVLLLRHQKNIPKTLTSRTACLV